MRRRFIVPYWVFTLDDPEERAYAAGQLYVNFHSEANPGGEIRGQILPENIEVIFAALAGGQERNNFV